MKTHRIAVIPGDGIGPEVTAPALRVLERAAEIDGTFRLELSSFDWGVEHHERTGRVVPEDMLEVLQGFDAIFLGALGWPERLADHIALEPLIRLRQAFDQYACVRPARLRPGVRCPLADPGDIDILVIRENTEGEYVPVGGQFHPGRDEQVAVQTAVHTRRGIERILRFGFEQARKRRGKLTMITKSNVLGYGMVLWDQILESTRGEFPDVQAEKMHVDAAAMKCVRQPADFDVIVASNLFGDILTDLSGAIVGSLGLNPSANLNPAREHPSMFEPVHGSAPDIVGRGLANPAAAVLSGAMMLSWLGHADPASRIEQAVNAVLAAGEVTPDLGGTLTTDEMGERIRERLDR
jgi:tartrate dehydrogenase/decarboxylase/D-malate dehydrogenase